jgi:hypothetical protein
VKKLREAYGHVVIYEAFAALLPVIGVGVIGDGRTTTMSARCAASHRSTA